MTQNISCLNRFSPENYIEGIKEAKVVMVALSVIAFGILGGGVTVCYLTPSLGWDYAIFGLSGITFASAIAIPLFSAPSKQTEPSENPSANVNDGETQAAEDVFATWDARDLLPQILSYLSPQDLARAARVSKHWYNTVNKEGSATKRRLDHAYECFLLREEMPETLRNVMGDLEEIPTISDFQKKPIPQQYFIGEDGLLTYCPHPGTVKLLLPVFEREKSAILKGQDNKGNWFFVIRFQGCEEVHGIIKILQKDRNEPGPWFIKSHMLFEFDKENILEIDDLIPLSDSSNIRGTPLEETWAFTWLSKLLSGQPCGKSDRHNTVVQMYFHNWHRHKLQEGYRERALSPVTLWQPL